MTDLQLEQPASLHRLKSFVRLRSRRGSARGVSSCRVYQEQIGTASAIRTNQDTIVFGLCNTGAAHTESGVAGPKGASNDK